MEKLTFDSSITAKIFHQAKNALHQYVGEFTREWGQLALTELNDAVDRVELATKGKSIHTGELSAIQEAEEKLLKAIVSALLEAEAPVKEEAAEPAPKAPAKKKK